MRLSLTIWTGDGGWVSEARVGGLEDCQHPAARGREQGQAKPIQKEVGCRQGPILPAPRKPKGGRRSARCGQRAPSKPANQYERQPRHQSIQIHPTNTSYPPKTKKENKTTLLLLWDTLQHSPTSAAPPAPPTPVHRALWVAC